MKCDQVRRAFSDLYDERLSGPPLGTITQHLATCQECRAEWTDFRKAMLAVSDLGGAEPSLGSRGRGVLLPPAPPPRARRSRNLRPKSGCRSDPPSPCLHHPPGKPRKVKGI